MKKYLMMLVAFMGMFILAGCSDSPKEVAEKWAQALLDEDIDEANKYSTEKVHAVNGLAVTGMKTMKGEEKEKQIKKMEEMIEKIQKAEEKIDGDTARLVVDGDDSFTMKKVDGDWKVDVNKR